MPKYPLLGAIALATLGSTPEIPGYGSLQGKFESRDTILLQVGVTWGSL